MWIGGLCIKGQRVLDIGTGTGVLPRNMYKFGARWAGKDISTEQIEQAKILADASKLKIDFQAVPTEQIEFEKECLQRRGSVIVRGRTELLNPA